MDMAANRTKLESVHTKEIGLMTYPMDLEQSVG